MAFLTDLFTCIDEETEKKLKFVKCTNAFKKDKSVILHSCNVKLCQFIVTYRGRSETITVTFNKRWEIELGEFICQPLKSRKIVLKRVMFELDANGDVTDVSLEAVVEKIQNQARNETAQIKRQKTGLKKKVL